MPPVALLRPRVGGRQIVSSPVPTLERSRDQLSNGTVLLSIRLPSIVAAVHDGIRVESR